jgi:hypothetical protein
MTKTDERLNEVLALCDSYSTLIKSHLVLWEGQRDQMDFLAERARELNEVYERAMSNWEDEDE